MELVERLLRGDVRALARAIRLVEERAEGAEDTLRSCFSRAGRATVVGITGPPGAGKSTLLDGLVRAYRSRGARVGVVAVDPSSAFSGGAILADRIRMQDHATDPGVFIRSMASRGKLGGLAPATSDAVDLLDAAGYDPIFVETVGVGQDEIEVARAADAVAVVLVPGMGDDIQAIKAGILEIADLFVINKADRQGADRLVSDLEAMLSLSGGNRRPEIVRTVATREEGIPELLAALDRFFRAGGEARKEDRRRAGAEARLRAILAERLLGEVLERAIGPESLAALVEEIASRQLDPYTAAERVLARMGVRGA